MGSSPIVSRYGYRASPVANSDGELLNEEAADFMAYSRLVALDINSEEVDIPESILAPSPTPTVDTDTIPEEDDETAAIAMTSYLIQMQIEEDECFARELHDHGLSDHGPDQYDDVWDNLSHDWSHLYNGPRDFSDPIENWWFRIRPGGENGNDPTGNHPTLLNNHAVETSNNPTDNNNPTLLSSHPVEDNNPTLNSSNTMDGNNPMDNSNPMDIDDNSIERQRVREEILHYNSPPVYINTPSPFNFLDCHYYEHRNGLDVESSDESNTNSSLNNRDEMRRGTDDIIGRTINVSSTPFLTMEEMGMHYRDAPPDHTIFIPPGYKYIPTSAELEAVSINIDNTGSFVFMATISSGDYGLTNWQNFFVKRFLSLCPFDKKCWTMWAEECVNPDICLMCRLGTVNDQMVMICFLNKCKEHDLIEHYSRYRHHLIGE